MDSTLNVQQWIQQCIRADYKNIDNILTCPSGVEEGVWKYEHLRQFCMELNGLAVLLQVDTPCRFLRSNDLVQDECKPETCVQMTATEQWIFLCAAHKNPKEVSSTFWTTQKTCLISVLSDRLYSTHAGRRRLTAEQQPLLLEPNHHKRVVHREDRLGMPPSVSHFLSRLLPPPESLRHL